MDKKRKAENFSRGYIAYEIAHKIQQDECKQER